MSDHDEEWVKNSNMEEREHIADEGTTCWCDPEVIHVDYSEATPQEQDVDHTWCETSHTDMCSFRWCPDCLLCWKASFAALRADNQRLRRIVGIARAALEGEENADNQRLRRIVGIARAALKGEKP